jgi:hypothetical protein
LCDNALGLEILRIVHLVAGITDPTGGMYVHQVAEIDDFQGIFLALGEFYVVKFVLIIIKIQGLCKNALCANALGQMSRTCGA